MPASRISSEALAWFESSRLRYNRLRCVLWLAEGHLRRGDRAAARPLIEDAARDEPDDGLSPLRGSGRAG